MLKGTDLLSKFGEQMQKIELHSRELYNHLCDNGLDLSCAESLLKYFSEDSSLQKYDSIYRGLLENNVDAGYFFAIKDIKNIDTLINSYSDLAITANEKKMPVEEFKKILNENEELYDIEEKLDAFELKEEPEEIEEQPTPAEESVIDSKEELKEEQEDKKDIESEIIVRQEEPEKNFFTQTIEDLLGVSTDVLEQEEMDGNLDMLVKSITDAISEDKRKTNLINNLRRIVILANKQVGRMTDRLNKCSEIESELRGQIYHLTKERDDYKKKYEELNNKINELTSLTMLAGGVKRIE